MRGLCTVFWKKKDDIMFRGKDFSIKKMNSIYQTLLNYTNSLFLKKYFNWQKEIKIVIALAKCRSQQVMCDVYQ